MQPLLSVIIVNWNTRELLAQCLESLYQTIHVPCEVIVVDNASEDGSAEMVRSVFPQVRLIENTENVGFARANNQAIRAGRGKYVLLLNSDTIVQPGALDSIVRFADQHPEAGIVGGRLLNADGSLQPSWNEFPTLLSELMGRNFRRRRPLVGESAYEVDWVGGACLLAQREAIEAVGLLDENFFMYSEEADWCYRMIQNGWKVYYFPKAKVIHFGGGSSHRCNEAMVIQLYRSKLLFFHKHYGMMRSLCLRYALLLRFAIKGAMMGILYVLSGGRYATGRRLMQRQLVLIRGLGFSGREK